MKQYGYLYATFLALIVIGCVLLSLSYCGGKTDAKMDERDIIIEQQSEQIKALESQIDQALSNTRKANEVATENKYLLELKIHSYDSLRKAKIVIPTRNTNVSDDSLRSIWSSQI